MPKPKIFNSSGFFGNLLDKFEEGFGFPHPLWRLGLRGGGLLNFFCSSSFFRRSFSRFFQNDATGPSGWGFFELGDFLPRVDDLCFAEGVEEAEEEADEAEDAEEEADEADEAEDAEEEEGEEGRRRGWDLCNFCCSSSFRRSSSRFFQNDATAPSWGFFELGGADIINE